MGIEGPSLVRLLDNLSAKNLIVRKTDKEDRRSKSIHLSTSAHALFEELDRLALEARQELLGDISASDLQTCIQVFEKILVKPFPKQFPKQFSKQFSKQREGDKSSV